MLSDLERKKRANDPQGDTDVANLVRNLAPSYNVSMQPISAASSIVRPAYLRHLALDHTRSCSTASVAVPYAQAGGRE